MYDFTIDLKVVRPASLVDGTNGMAQITATLNTRLVTSLDGYQLRLRNISARTDRVYATLFASTDRLLDSQDVRLTASPIQILLPRSMSNSVNIAYNTQLADLAQPSYYLIAKIDADYLVELGAALDNNKSLSLANVANSDPILVWTSCALNAVKSAGSNGKPGVGPTVGSRLAAMLTTAMLNTVAAFDPSVKVYNPNGTISLPTISAGIDRNAAIVGAAQRILSLELPGESTIIQDQLNSSSQALTAAGLSQANINASLAVGAAIADQIRALRANDGSANNTPYTAPTPPPGLEGYVWMPATSGPMMDVALGCNWGSVTPWMISGPSNPKFKSDGLQARPDVNLGLYAEQLAEVRLFGGLTNTATTTLQRTADQTDIAKFWAYDRPDTFRPYGQLLDIAMEVAQKQGTDQATNAELLASLSTSMADSVICAWNEKYTEVQPRPYDLITGQFSDNDNTPVTVRDAEWRTLLSPINGVESPPFPDYMSGHSVMGGAFAAVMTNFFGDNVTFSTTSQDLPGVVRSFSRSTETDQAGTTVTRSSFYNAGMEDAISRIYGGVHIREACLDSFDVGHRVGNAVAEMFLSNQPLTTLT
jgi:hypothetical protein